MTLLAAEHSFFAQAAHFAAIFQTMIANF